VDEETNQPLAADIYDPELWVRMNWGLANPTHDKVLATMLPGVSAPPLERRLLKLFLQIFDFGVGGFALAFEFLSV